MLTIGDTKSGWTTICQLAQALERYQIKDVKQRPLEIGESPELGNQSFHSSKI